MVIAWLCLASVAAGTPVPSPALPERPGRPEAPAPVEGQCEAPMALRAGFPPPAGLVGSDGLVRCGAVALPTSEAADLALTEDYALALEVWGDAVTARYRLDLAILERDRDWFRERMELAEKPPPFWLRPGVQRSVGRLETLVTLAAVGGVVYGISRVPQP